VLALAWLAIAGPAAGDWLVTRSGQRIYTKGAWTVKDDRVLFHTANGTLTALPLASIDVGASRAASSPPPPLPTPPARHLVATVRLTDQEVGHVGPSEYQGPASGEPATGSDEATDQHRVIVYSAVWCKFCTLAKAYLTRHGIPFTEKDIDKDPAAKAELAVKLPGYRGLPVIDVDGKLLRGFNPASLGQALGLPPEPPAKPSTRSPGRR
jgi:glutaredoxin